MTGDSYVRRNLRDLIKTLMGPYFGGPRIKGVRGGIVAPDRFSQTSEIPPDVCGDCEEGTGGARMSELQETQENPLLLL